MRIDSRGVLPQDRLDVAALLEESVPVDRREQTEAEHAVTDRNLVGGLAVMLAAEDLVGVGALRGQLGLEVLERGHGPFLVPQELHQPDHERVAQAVEAGQEPGLAPDRGRVPRSGGWLRWAKSAPAQRGEEFGPLFGAAAFLPAPDHPLGQAPEVLEEDQPEHGGQSPELADGQGCGLLERPDEPGDSRLVELAVAVGDQRQGQSIDPGIADQGRGSEFG